MYHHFFLQLVHSLQFYKGDERIKTFIWDLVSQNDEDQLKNHSGLSSLLPFIMIWKLNYDTSNHFNMFAICMHTLVE